MIKIIVNSLKIFSEIWRRIIHASFWTNIQPECPICMSVLKENDDGELTCDNPLCFMSPRDEHL